MRSLVLLVPLSVALTMVGFVRADQPTPGKDAVKEAPTYTCPMHPKVQSAKPGSCPVCKRKLQVKQLAAGKNGPAPVDAITEHDAAVMDHAAMDHSTMEPAGMDAIGMEGMNCPMCKGMMGMSMGGSAADATAKVAKPLAPAGYQRPGGRRCGGGC